MKITRRQLNNLIRESIDREKLVRYIAGELSNRAYDIGLLDDINDTDPDALDFTLPEVLVSNLGPDPSQEQWSGLAKAIAQGQYDRDLADIADPEEDEDPGDPEEDEDSGDPAELRGIGSTPFPQTKSDYDNHPAWFNEGKIKITKGKLRQMIKEELDLTEADSNKDGKLSPDELRNIADKLDEPLRVWGIPYKDGFAYGGRRIISRDRAWLEFVPKGQEPDTKADMFRSVKLLEPDDPAVKKVIDNPRNSWYVRKHLKNATLDNFDVYSVYAHTTG